MLKRTLFIFLLFFLPSAFLFCQTTIEVYVSDAGNFSSGFQIVKFDENGENPQVFINEQLAWPQDIVFLEDQGVVLISSLNSGRITKHNATTGEYIENFATGIGGPTRMKIGADSLLYVLQWNETEPVLRYQLDGTFVDEFTSVGVNSSIGLDWDSAGNLYVSSFYGDAVRKFDASGNDQGLFANSNLAGPTNIFFRDNGDLIVLDWNAGSIKRFDESGAYQGVFINGLGNPEGVDFLPNGNMLIGNGGDGSVREFDADGNFVKNFIEPGAGGLVTPNAVIIREVMTVSTSEPEEVTDLIIPSIGTTFSLKTNDLPFSSTVQVFDVSGKLVHQKQVTDNQVWNAQAVPEGLYVIVLQSADGTARTQKVIVKK